MCAFCIPCSPGRPRRAVLLTPSSRSAHPALLPSYNSAAPKTPLESTLLQVFILKNLKSFRMNTSKKTRGRGVLWLTKIPSKCYLPNQQLPALVAVPRPPLESITCKRPICNPFAFKSLQTAGGCTPCPAIPAGNAQNTANRPLSFQSLASCSSRIPFPLMNLHFYGGGCTPLRTPSPRHHRQRRGTPPWRSADSRLVGDRTHLPSSLPRCLPTSLLPFLLARAVDIRRIARHNSSSAQSFVGAPITEEGE